MDVERFNVEPIINQYKDYAIKLELWSAINEFSRSMEIWKTQPILYIDTEAINRDVLKYGKTVKHS